MVMYTPLLTMEHSFTLTRDSHSSRLIVLVNIQVVDLSLKLAAQMLFNVFNSTFTTVRDHGFSDDEIIFGVYGIEGNINNLNSSR